MSEHLYKIQDNDLILGGQNKKYVLKIRDLPSEEKPREKMIKYGPSVLSSAELLAVILNVGTKKEDVLAMTSRILKDYGEKAIINQTDPKKVMETLNLPLAKSCQIISCFELGRRFFQPSKGRSVVLRTAKQVYNYLKDMRDLPKEHLRGLYLNNHCRLIHDEVIAIGSMTANIIHPREVFKPALEYSASAVILAHNHPSGSTKISKDDIKITEQVIEAGRILGIDLLDHIIITNGKFISIQVDYEKQL